MSNADRTLTSPISDAMQISAPLLALTIAWHPDLDRVGEQFFWADEAGALQLSRYLPLFAKPRKDGLALGHGGISRDPLRIARSGSEGIEIHIPESRMVVELNGREIRGAVRVSYAQLEGGVFLGLGRIVLICLHWMRCLPKDNPVPGFVGVGDAAVRARDLIRQAAAGDSSVLLLGETGTGKEVAASAIHALSKRASAPLVTVNMAALNESLAAADLFGAAKGAYTGAHATRNGLFGEAQDATLFLDEIGNTPPSVQPMLLRVLENGEYRPLGAQQSLHSTARLIAATDQDLYGDSFNQALLRRLESFIIHLPPLRQRREDIGPLMAHMLRGGISPGSADTTLSTSLVSRFLGYDWPGNIRQLAHVLKRTLLALQHGETLSFDALVDAPSVRMTDGGQQAEEAVPSANTPSSVPLASRKKLADIKEQDVLDAMEKHHWYIQGAAEELGVSRPSMYKLIDAHPQIRRIDQITPEEIRRALEASAGDVEHCAALLRTPSEALRRHLRALGWHVGV